MFRGPPVQLICPKNLTFAYVPGHLSHICFELLKNSLRAVVERYGIENEDDFPPIKVIVVEGKEDITVKLSDEGGGIPRSAIPLIWTYMYTTMESQGLDSDFHSTDFKAPMAGFGYGLPLSRLVCDNPLSALCDCFILTPIPVCSILWRRLAINFDGWIWD
jgi:pyruvate dehydrogenase kinase 2/3/4